MKHKGEKKEVRQISSGREFHSSAAATEKALPLVPTNNLVLKRGRLREAPKSNLGLGQVKYGGGSLSYHH